LSATGLPAGATFSDLGAGKGTFTWTPSDATHGVYFVTVSADSHGMTGAATFKLTVKFHANFTVDATGPTTLHASPGDHVTLEANVTNHNTEPDTYMLSFSQTQAWSGPQPIANARLDAGETLHLTLSLVVPASGTIDVANLTVTSLGELGATKKATWTADVPVVLTLKLDNAVLLPNQRATGYVRATYLNNASAKGISMTMTQTSDLLASITSGLAGKTDANGLWFFDWGTDANAKFVGTHTIVAKGGLPGVTPTTATDTYAVA
jgi:hypothetical protein